MNKKLLFAAMSLAALTACNSDDFESKNVAQQETSPVVFEVLNNNDAFTRASMDGNKIAWSAEDGDLFTLYHGAGVLGAVTGYQNATYKANASDGAAATLTTPSMILPGAAIMVWPADTTFRIGSGDNLTITIPDVQIPSEKHGDIANIIPYVSDQFTIGAYTGTDYLPTDYNTAGYQRTYPVYMRPMASQLIVKADYAGTDNTLATLYTGDDPIDPIKVTSIDLLTRDGGDDKFTKEIPVKFTDPAGTIPAQWATVANQAWGKVTDFNIGGIVAAGKTDKLTSKVLAENNGGCRFLLLPQADIVDGVDDGAVVVNTLYGKVVVAATGVAGSLYSGEEAADAWYRYLTDPATRTADETATTVKNDKNQTKVTSAIDKGMMQTINGFSGYKATSGITKGEPVGAAATRYVKVLLTHLDMTGLHVKTDKQLRDAAKVWQKMNLADVTVYLDGDDNNEFTISQKTIKVINDINASIAGGAKSFKVMPCDVDLCQKIVVTGGGDIQNMAFITFNDVDASGDFNAGDVKADVVFKAGETWKWNSTVTLAPTAETGVQSFVNEGTMENAATATLAIYDNAAPNPNQITNIPLVNKGTWNIKAGATINAKFDVWNTGTVNIEKGAQYREDGAGNTFYNYAETLPERFLPANDEELIGLVNNKGVFATVNSGTIINIGLIEHADPDAKTYITYNQYGPNPDYSGVDYANAFVFSEDNAAANMIGRINLPYENKNEDNISVSAALTQGFVSVTVDGEVKGELKATEVGPRVNYVIVKSGVTSIAAMPAQVKYLEINMTDKSEIAWSVTAATTYEGLIVLSPVNIKLGTAIHVTKACYLGADMYVGGTFDNNTPGVLPSWTGYYGNTTANFATKYITY